MLANNLRFEKVEVPSYEFRLETSAIVLQLGEQKILIVALYRPSNPENNVQFDFFFEKFENILDKLVATMRKRRVQRIILAGDFNINMLRAHAPAIRLGKLMEKFELYLVNEESATRVAAASSTLIDLIYYGPGEMNDAFASVVQNFFSDHESVICEVNVAVPVISDKFIEVRDFNDERINSFAACLALQNWLAVAYAATVDEKYDCFLSIFRSLFEQFFPKRRKLIRANQLTKTKLSEEVKRQRSLVFRLGKEVKKIPPSDLKDEKNAEFKIQKKEYLRRLNTEIRVSNNRVINNAENKTKAAWSLLKKSAGKVVETERIERVVVNGKEVCNPLSIASALNGTFVVPPPVELGNALHSPISLPTCNSSLFLCPAGVQEIISVLRSLPSKRSAGWDEIPIFLAKRVAPYIAAPLADIVNASFRDGVFPKSMKRAIVTPLFKKGDRLDVKNYRPISSLPTFSKILEKCFLLRLFSFYEVNNLLPGSQHGFIKGRCTATALFEFIVKLHEHLEKKQKVLGIFYDLSNAFGTICVPLLLRKFEFQGVRGVALEWLRSALTGRTQAVKLRVMDGKFEKFVYSEELLLERGTPQGGIISPFGFDVSIGDMPVHVAVGLLLNYADDSSSLVFSRTTCGLMKEAQLAVNLMSDFCRDNFLTLNQTKTVVLNFQLRRPVLDRDNFNLTLNGENLTESDVTKFLGLYLAHNLKWTEHSDYVVGKLNSAVFLINNLMHSVDEKYLKMVYYAYCHSIMSYGIVIWGGSNRALDEVFLAQKKVVRALAGERYWRSTEPLCSAKPLFARFGFLPIFSIYLFESCKFVRKYPHYLKKTSEVHDHQTRAKCDLYVPAQALLISNQNPLTCMSSLYNKLPVSVRLEPRYKGFETSLRRFVHVHKFYDRKEFFQFMNAL
ncbi:uncharacterized protein LOC132199839 [Neocloeon triangulifer]|uniref:uncharacterized protein LOC132199839 n=1 Tax=Neocloeon triangulifer TaxID=2078957 RepID=UPI00286ED5F9|nr:uncharacterized protein LOC132199839 [Neocloeon triangulifer]XP_059480864.1 uncharacterized protein LOC132199839 [Neocloeon triangulifer]